VSFSPDSRHLVFTEISEPGYVEVVRVAATTRERTCFIENRLAPLKPKSVAFSHDGRFAAIAMGLNGTRDRQALASGGMVTVHHYDAANGVLAAQAITELKGAGVALASVDMCTFLPTISGEPYRILVADQGADALLSFEFDAEQQTITSTDVFAAGLSFPHGVDVSANGRFVAMTNYEDDTVRIARVTPSIASADERATVSLRGGRTLALSTHP
jgi:6-phosphogluconolactonase (cycloisomerase 2 family)